MMECNSGVYSLTNKINGKMYIGSAYNFKNRWRNHKSLLIRGTHHSSHLQNAWNLYGEDSFIFEVLCYVNNLDSLLMVEQVFLNLYDTCDRRYGYNISLIAGAPMTGRKHSKETKIKIGRSWLGKKHTPETKLKMGKVQSGHKVSEETRHKISVSNKGKLGHVGKDNPSYHDIPQNELRSYLFSGLTVKIISKIYGVCEKTIYNKMKSFWNTSIVSKVRKVLNET